MALKVAINTTTQMLEYLFKYDSVHSGIDAKIIDNKTIQINGKSIALSFTREINELDFECTGVFLTTDKAQAYLKNGVKKVVMSAPAKDDTPTYILNINTDQYKWESIVSNASCTTNCLAPIRKVLAWYDNEWGYSSRLVDMCLFVGDK